MKKTYLTQGLGNLLHIVEKRLHGDGGDPVIQIQTLLAEARHTR